MSGMTPERLEEIRNRNEHRPLVGVASELFDALDIERARLDWYFRYNGDYGEFLEHYGLPIQTSRVTGSADEWRAAIDDAREKGAAR